MVSEGKERAWSAARGPGRSHVKVFQDPRSALRSSEEMVVVPRTTAVLNFGMHFADDLELASALLLRDHVYPDRRSGPG